MGEIIELGFFRHKSLFSVGVNRTKFMYVKNLEENLAQGKHCKH